jgi:predicted Zn-dependent peptidase
VRDELGAAYYVGSGTEPGLDHGEFVIFAGLNHAKLPVAIEVILKECRALKDRPLTHSELDETKRKLVGKFAVNLETSDIMAGYFGSQEIVGTEVLTPEEEIKRYMAVVAEDIQKAAKDIFRNNGLNLALLGPLNNDEILQPLLTVE